MSFNGNHPWGGDDIGAMRMAGERRRGVWDEGRGGGGGGVGGGGGGGGGGEGELESRGQWVTTGCYGTRGGRVQRNA